MSARRVAVGAVLAFTLPFALASVPLGLFGSHAVWNFACFLVAVVAVRRVAKKRTGLSVAIGLGATYGLVSVVALIALAAGADACRQGGLRNAGCSSLVAFFTRVLAEVLLAIGFAFWLGKREGRASRQTPSDPSAR